MIVKSKAKLETSSNEIEDLLDLLSNKDFPEDTKLVSITEVGNINAPEEPNKFVLEVEWEVELS